MSRVEKDAKVASELSSLRSEIGSVARSHRGRKFAVTALVGALGLLVVVGIALGVAFSTGMMYIDVPTLTVRMR